MKIAELELGEWGVFAGFIREMCACYGRGIEPDDLQSEAWTACLEADNTYHKYAGCYSYDEYMFLHVRESLNRMRVQNHRQISLQSRWQFDSGREGSFGTASNWCPAPYRSGMRAVEDYVELADFWESLLPEERIILKKLMMSCPCSKIAVELNAPIEKVREVRHSLREKARNYFTWDNERLIA